ncbi:hypothetical protein KQ51_00020 [Candidatus Izimaplasma bacterium HR1]|jgi:hypothetical protein|uniref:hypothetical protein n=1 Tax=Candidatus Izimoplasma sp. HR1 TaxID=1541959 RepID=UPI0004F92BD7|nr:hypothetical protein KQ51_00020 [Candidatus Izimaplasma bacterium HR1]
MKNMVIKGLVLVMAFSAYFNVSQILKIKTLNENNQVLQENISDLEDQLEILEQQIIDLEEDEDVVIDTCNKLYEIVIKIKSQSDDLDNTYTHCTNKAYLGDALDEVADELGIVHDPRYDKEYIYGRMIISFYSVQVTFEEYYQITINGEYAQFGIDLIELEDGNNYEFTLVRWAS